MTLKTKGGRVCQEQVPLGCVEERHSGSGNNGELDDENSWKRVESEKRVKLLPLHYNLYP